jgi:hypothetical protein
MGSDESEQVLALLKELSVLKELENEAELGPTANSKQDARRIRQQEIAEEIQSLAEQKKIKDTSE